MKKILISLVLIILSISILFAGGQQASNTASSTATPPGKIPPWMNPDGYFPIVKPGNNISLTVSWVPDATMGLTSDPSQIWWFTFVKEAFNINLDVIVRPQGAEAKNLVFASGDLPDIWFDRGFSTNDVMNYGVSEKLIIPITNYITPELMPNLYKVLQDPDFRNPLTAFDGNIYGIPNFRDKNLMNGPMTGGLARHFYNKVMLDKVGLQVPQTLDEYLAVLRAFKTLGPDILPDAGNFQNTTNYALLYSALGFHWTQPNTLNSVGLYNNKADFIFANKNIFPKFVETYNTMYKEGLISPDFFTMDLPARNAITMPGKGGVVSGSPYSIVDAKLCFDYIGAKPLTSEFNNTPFWIGPSNLIIDNLVTISAKNKYPEAVCRMFDFNFTTQNYMLMTDGYPDTMPQYLYGMLKGWTVKDNRIDLQIDNPAMYPSDGHYGNSRIRPMQDVPGLMGYMLGEAMSLYSQNPIPESFDLTQPDGFGRSEVWKNLTPYVVPGFPYIVYWDTDTSKRISDLATVINDYVTVQFAQFVTGARPLSDLPKYFDDLDKLNYQEYLKYYSDYWARLNAGK
ncbi:MAG: extracellular solute-binding protein [Treponema sp.]|nr:extracellular solute-binding protein [Treponema sp.]